MGLEDKRRLQALLAEAAGNTPGARPATPVSRETPPPPPDAPVPAQREAVESHAPPRPPTAHEIATAIVAASRALGADPLKVASGVTGMGGRYADHSVPRARAYAAHAIATVFPLLTPTAIANYVKAPNPNSYMAVLAHHRRNSIRWWDESVSRRVIKATREATS